MPKYHSVTISFKPSTIDLYEFLQTKSNKSAYILQLIEKDMEVNETVFLKEKIKGIILEVLKEDDMDLRDIRIDSEKDRFTNDDINIINEYF